MRSLFTISDNCSPTVAVVALVYMHVYLQLSSRERACPVLFGEENVVWSLSASPERKYHALMLTSLEHRGFNI